ncbi:hypothetical protein PR001_g19655 [Phytophthora rubi]|uniref:Uncharacterized protein n=1 Tax=Phytophthora rubi TaxID=129364 RepID=A0A6A3JZF4_9STRA|nr:hypothetical protein PR001_g19655 [Phytophthora rubi]KAE8997785.1 hypothetical protein PR002_g18934 [Phytophthora rubi]
MAYGDKRTTNNTVGCYTDLSTRNVLDSAPYT